MGDTRTLKVVIAGDAKGARHALGQVDSGLDRTSGKASILSKGMGGLGRGIAGLAGAAAIGLGAAALGLGAFVAGGIQTLKRVETLNKATETVIKSTGGAARISTKQIVDLAESIEELTGLEMESVEEGANMLLTFTDIQNRAGKGNDIFTQATKILTDMSVALGTDMKSQAIQLGKALNNPIKGVAALSKVGVTFTKQQKEQIKTMVEAGDVAGAQKVILKELNKEFGGQAAAFGQTTAGKIEKAKNALGNFQEALAGAFMPLLGKLAEKAIPFFKKLTDAWPEIEAKIKGFVSRVWPVVSKVFGFLFKLFQGKGTTPAITGYFTKIQGKVKELAAVLIPIVKKIVKVFREQLVPMFIDLWDKAQPVITDIGDAVSELYDFLVALFTRLSQVIGPLWDKYGSTIIATIKQFVGGIFSILSGAFQIIKGIFKFFTGLLTGDWGKAWQGIKDILSGAWEIIKGIFNVIVSTFRVQWEAIKSGAIVAWNLLWARIVEITTGLASWLRAKFNGIVAFFRGIPGRMKNIFFGAFDGLKGAFQSAVNWLIGKWNNLSFTIPSFNGDWNGPLPGGDFSVGGWTIGTPDIPYLAAGGLVKARPGGRLAVLGDGGEDEAVIPLSKLRGVSRGDYSGPVAVYVTVNVRGSVMAEKDLVKSVATGVRDEIARIGKRNGGSTGL